MIFTPDDRFALSGVCPDYNPKNIALSTKLGLSMTATAGITTAFDAPFACNLWSSFAQLKQF